MKNTAKSHRRFNPEDYKKLKSKGYSEPEIVNIWDEDIAKIALADLLWMDARNPEATEKFLSEFQRLRKENPFSSNPQNNA